MKRQEWKFNYKVADILSAAREKLAFHQGRLSWWNEKKEEVMQTVRAEGLEIDESVAAGYSNSARGPQVMVRLDLQRDLSECVGKIDEHKRRVAEYDAWVQVLTAQDKDQELKLNHDDWLFFYGK